MIQWTTYSRGGYGRIIDLETGRDLFIQTDWDLPAIAGVFGWSVAEAARPMPEHYTHSSKAGKFPAKFTADQVSDFRSWESEIVCQHSTDGTVPCRDCGLPTIHFIETAAEWLADNDGLTAEDPGYFA